MTDTLKVKGYIYKLQSAIDDKFYIGHTKTSVELRFERHKISAKLSPNQKIYKHFNSIGWDHVYHSVISEILEDEIHYIKEIENDYILKYRPQLNTYKSFIPNCIHNKNKRSCHQCNGKIFI